ncbi:MAG TPA: hypothetical protein VGR46_15310 [Candidatus Limnocylindria bacterium]|jgi:hypothetical protein|nr:hypothetical protein [Candidatus Limnocylindria bacterium]
MDFWKRLTPLVPDERLPNLGQVDPFDDTRFNYKACAELLGEIQLLRAHPSIAEDVAFLERVEALVSRVASTQHRYIGSSAIKA